METKAPNPIEHMPPDLARALRAVDLLQDFVLGNRRASRRQIAAAREALDRVLPDLAPEPNRKRSAAQVPARRCQRILSGLR